MPTTTPNTRNARLDFRLSPEHKRMIEQAATARGQSVSEFAVSYLVEAAQRTIEQETMTRLSRRDRDAFLRLIEADAKPNKTLKQAAARHQKRRG